MPEGRAVAQQERVRSSDSFCASSKEIMPYISAWQIHLTKFRSTHPDLSLKQAMQGASETYRASKKEDEEEHEEERAQKQEIARQQLMQDRAGRQLIQDAARRKGARTQNQRLAARKGHGL